MSRFHLGLLILAAAGIPACATSERNRRLDEKVAQQSDVNTRKDLDAKAATLLKSTPGLSPRQKEDLAALKASVQAKLGENTAQSLKLRQVLVDDVLASGDHAAEILEVKSRLRRLSKERIDVLFDAINQANDALGRSDLIREAMDLQRMQDHSKY